MTDENKFNLNRKCIHLWVSRGVGKCSHYTKVDISTLYIQVMYAYFVLQGNEHLMIVAGRYYFVADAIIVFLLLLVNTSKLYHFTGK